MVSFYFVLPSKNQDIQKQNKTNKQKTLNVNLRPQCKLTDTLSVEKIQDYFAKWTVNVAMSWLISLLLCCSEIVLCVRCNPTNLIHATLIASGEQFEINSKTGFHVELMDSKMFKVYAFALP